jgi:hypothetical protein
VAWKTVTKKKKLNLNPCLFFRNDDDDDSNKQKSYGQAATYTYGRAHNLHCSVFFPEDNRTSIVAICFTPGVVLILSRHPALKKGVAKTPPGLKQRDVRTAFQKQRKMAQRSFFSHAYSHTITHSRTHRPNIFLNDSG